MVFTCHSLDIKFFAKQNEHMKKHIKHTHSFFFDNMKRSLDKFNITVQPQERFEGLQECDDRRTISGGHFADLPHKKRSSDDAPQVLEKLQMEILYIYKMYDHMYF